MRDAINTGLNNIERIDPSFTENAKKRLARLLKRVTPVILKKLLNKSYCKKYIFTYLVNFYVKKICVYSKN